MALLTLMVCPHDTVQSPDRWYRLVQYLAKQIADQVHFELTLDFREFHEQMTQADIIYANPADALKLIDQGFSPLVRPAEAYDEVVLIAGPDSVAKNIQALNGHSLAVVRGLVPTNLALYMLDQHGVILSKQVACDSWLGVVSCVARGEAEYGAVYRDTFQSLSEQSRVMVQVCCISNEQVAFHSLLIGPKLRDRQDELLQLLTKMHTTPTGCEMLAELGIPEWLIIQPEDLARLQDLVMQYA